MTICRRCRVVHSRLRRESMPEIISVYSYVGRGGGDVLTSSVNKLYLSGGFIRGFSPPPPPPPFPRSSLPLRLFFFLLLLLVAPQLVLVPRRPFLLMILASLWQTRIRDTRNLHFPNWRIQPFGSPELFMSPLKSQPATSRDGIKMSCVFVEIFAVRETCTRENSRVQPCAPELIPSPL